MGAVADAFGKGICSAVGVSLAPAEACRSGARLRIAAAARSKVYFLFSACIFLISPRNRAPSDAVHVSRSRYRHTASLTFSRSRRSSGESSMSG
jgi:hypothetical protein